MHFGIRLCLKTCLECNQARMLWFQWSRKKGIRIAIFWRHHNHSSFNSIFIHDCPDFLYSKSSSNNVSWLYRKSYRLLVYFNWNYPHLFSTCMGQKNCCLFKRLFARYSNDFDICNYNNVIFNIWPPNNRTQKWRFLNDQWI